MRQPPLRLHCQINVCRAKEPQTEYAITLRQPRFSIDPPPRLGKFPKSTVLSGFRVPVGAKPVFPSPLRNLALAASTG